MRNGLNKNKYRQPSKARQVITTIGLALSNLYRDTHGGVLFLLLLLVSTAVQGADNPLPPEGEPLPEERLEGHHLSCPGGGGTKIEEVPMAVVQSCGQLNFKELPRPEGAVCGRKGRKEFKACIHKKVNGCVELSNIQERRVPNNYCPGLSA